MDTLEALKALVGMKFYMSIEHQSIEHEPEFEITDVTVEEDVLVITAKSLIMTKHDSELEVYAMTTIDFEIETLKPSMADHDWDIEFI